MSDTADAIVGLLIQLLVTVQGVPAIPQDYIDKGWVRGDECGDFTNLCWHALMDQGIGPLTIDKRSGLTYLRAMGRTLWCESRWNPFTVYVNRNGSRDRGIAQWNDAYWPDITDALAFDPWYAISRMAEQWKLGRQELWVCYKLLFTG